MNIVLLQSAQQELLQTIEFYEDQLPGLGLQFSEEIADGIELIRLFPEGCQAIAPKTRKIHLAQIPLSFTLRHHQQCHCRFSHRPPTPQT